MLSESKNTLPDNCCTLRRNVLQNRKLEVLMTGKEMVETIKWELELLMKNQKDLRLSGRDLDWNDGERLKQLRIRLDKEMGILQPKKEEDDGN